MTRLQQAFERIDQYAQLKMNEAKVPGMAVAITDREKLLRVSTYGFADLASRAPILPDSLFEIGSIGKSFTDIALLQLHQEGKLDLYAPVTQYLPWFQVKTEYSPITVYHLMNHIAGIVRGTEMAPHGLYESWALRETKTSVPPGEYWHYSSVGYKILGFILERLTGQSYQDVIRTRVLEPLGMAQSHPVVTFETRKRAATGYCRMYDDRPEHSSHDLVSAVWSEFGTGDGCLASTANDMGIYLRMIINRGQGPRGRLVSDDVFDLITDPDMPVGSEYYSCGLAVYPVEGHTYLGHGGATAGYVSSIVVDTEEGLGAVGLTNMTGETDAAASVTFYALAVLRAAYDQKEIPTLPALADPGSVPDAADYAGTYRAGSRVVRVTAEGRKLLLNYDGRVIALERRGPDSFYVGDPELDLFLLEFRRENGIVVELFHGPHWYINGHYSGPQRFDYPEEWEAYPGHYRARNPELSNFRVVLRKGALVLIRPSGAAESLVPLGDRIFRIGGDHRSPETLRFDAVVEGRALQSDYSGCPYYRTFSP